MSVNKNLKGIKKFINETVLFIEWAQQHISDDELHNDIHLLIKKDEQMDPLDFSIDTSKLTRINEFLDKKDYKFSEAIELFKIAQETFKSFISTINNLKSIHITDSYLHSYLGALFFIYLKKKNKYSHFIIRFIFFILAMKEDDDELAREYSIQAILPRSTYEKIGGFLINLIQAPKQAWNMIYPFLRAVLISPTDTGKAILSFCKNEFLGEVEENDIPFLNEVIDQEVRFRLGESDNEEHLEFIFNLEGISPYKQISTVNGETNFEKELNNDWQNEIHTNFKNFKLIFDQEDENPINLNFGTSFFEFILNNKSGDEISITLNGTGKTFTVGLKGNATYTKNWDNNWKTEVNAAANNFNSTIDFENSERLPAVKKGDYSVDLTHEKEINEIDDKISGSYLDSGYRKYTFQLSNTGVKAIAAIKGAQLYIDPSEGDGFLSSTVPDKKRDFELFIELGYSMSKGFYLKGNLGQEIMLPLYETIGPVTFRDLFIKWNLGNQDKNGLSVDFATSIDLDLSVMDCTIEQIGFSSNIDFPENNPTALSFGFKPPTGVALSLNTGIINGGGFLSLDHHKGQYSGALEFSFSDFVSLSAIGVIETKMPDGSKGFSMIMVITADFGSGIQLGFGFTLLEVGGLMGLNRTMKLDALMSGVKSGSINSVMFPVDVIKNAPRIIRDLQGFFPVKQGTFLIGPMAKMGWGTPTLISLSLGIIIEIPGDIAIIGILKIVLPDEHAPLLVFQVNFMGKISFDKKELWFYAVLFESRVLTITLEGEMGLFVSWGNHPNFVASLGGFHPSFQPPALPFQSLQRISFNLLNTSAAKIRIEGYFAVTSNTVQFGARAEMYFGFSALHVEGHLNFDALFQFSPFYMILQISASLSVKVFGAGLFSLGLDAKLEGPGPWKIHGKGKIKICWFWKVTVNISTTWGDQEDTTLPPIRIMPLIVAELEKKDNWKAVVPQHNRIGVSLKEIEAANELVLHPIGTLQVRQRAIPLGIKLDKVGAQEPKDYHKFIIGPTNNELSKTKDLNEQFALGQFKEMKDVEKISAPPFEKVKGGIELSAAGKQIEIGKSVKRHVRFDLTILDDNFKRRAAKMMFSLLKIIFGVFLKGNATSRAKVSFMNKRQREPFIEKIEKRDLGYALANTKDNTILPGEMIFGSQVEALDFMKGKITENPSLSGKVHVLPTTELNPAA